MFSLHWYRFLSKYFSSCCLIHCTSVNSSCISLLKYFCFYLYAEHNLYLLSRLSALALQGTFWQRRGVLEISGNTFAVDVLDINVFLSWTNERPRAITVAMVVASELVALSVISRKVFGYKIMRGSQKRIAHLITIDTHQKAILTSTLHLNHDFFLNFIDRVSLQQEAPSYEKRTCRQTSKCNGQCQGLCPGHQ